MAARKIARLTVICQEWLESERGWGCRPDGASLHLTSEDKDAYVKDYWEGMPKDHTPDEYTRPDGNPKLIEVTRTVYNQVKKSKNGIRLWQNEYRELGKPVKSVESTKTDARRKVLEAKRKKLQAAMAKLLAEIEALP